MVYYRERDARPLARSLLRRRPSIPPVMPIVTIVFGLLLAALGVYGYTSAVPAHVTALIPAFFGVAFIVLGALATRPSLLRHAMHAAAALGLLALLGSARGVPDALRVLSGEVVARPAMATSQGLMFVLCAIFVALCVRSFMAARRERGRVAAAAAARR